MGSVIKLSKKINNSYLELKKSVEEKLVMVDERIEQKLQSNVDLVKKMSSYHLETGGKKLRALITLGASKLCGYRKGSRDVNFAACVELIHSATLMHDDVIDNGEIRRGKKTLNTIWGNQSSILVGDYLLSRCFEMMVEDGNLEILKLLSSTSALISQGEILQVGIEKKLDASQEDYLKVIQGKTSALFSAACQAGAEITETSDSHVQALRVYGECIGTSFQLIDDLLDYLGDENKMWKNTGNDFFEKKITLPIIHAYEHSSAPEKKFIEETFKKSTLNQTDLNNFLEILENRKSLLFTKNQASIWTERSINALQIIENSDVKALMIGLAEEILDRVS